MRLQGLVLAGALLGAMMLTLVDPIAGTMKAEGYKWLPGSANHATCKYPSSTINWKNVSLTSAHLTDVRITNAFWNDIGANFYLKETTGTNFQIQYDSVNRNDVSWAGLGNPPANCSNNVYQGIGGVILNSFNIGTNRDNIQNVAAHETGHALGLDHTQAATQGGSGDELMWAVMQSDIVAPTLDEIRAVKTKYGTANPNSTPQCNEQPSPNPNGDVTYAGTCSSTNPAMSMTELITTATSSSKASAFTKTTAVAPPSQGYVITAMVKANTVNKFIVGTFTSTDVSNTLNRFMAIEMSSDGFYLVRSTSTGFTRTLISSTVPTVGQEYFLELVVRNGLPSKAYVFINNGGPTNPPDDLNPGTIVTASTGFTWSSPVYHGTGVWMTSSIQAKPSYTISSYFNPLKNSN